MADSAASPLPEGAALEHDAHDLLLSGPQAPLIESFGGAPEADPAVLQRRKDAADHLVKPRLMRYEDEARTRLSLTNPGRYWALNGGYMAFPRRNPIASPAATDVLAIRSSNSCASTP